MHVFLWKRDKWTYNTIFSCLCKWRPRALWSSRAYAVWSWYLVSVMPGAVMMPPHRWVPSKYNYQCEPTGDLRCEMMFWCSPFTVPATACSRDELITARDLLEHLNWSYSYPATLSDQLLLNNPYYSTDYFCSYKNLYFCSKFTIYKFLDICFFIICKLATYCHCNTFNP